MSDVCKSCWRWKKFKEKCWYHWDGKKECFKHIDNENSEESYKNVDKNTDIY